MIFRLEFLFARRCRRRFGSFLCFLRDQIADGHVGRQENMICRGKIGQIRPASTGPSPDLSRRTCRIRCSSVSSSLTIVSSTSMPVESNSLMPDEISSTELISASIGDLLHDVRFEETGVCKIQAFIDAKCQHALRCFIFVPHDVAELFAVTDSTHNRNMWLDSFSTSSRRPKWQCLSGFLFRSPVPRPRRMSPAMQSHPGDSTATTESGS